jgi:hypothetical protein
MTINQLRNEGIVDNTSTPVEPQVNNVNVDNISTESSEYYDGPIIKIGPDSVSESSKPQEVSISDLKKNGTVQEEKLTEDALKKQLNDTINNGGLQESVNRRIQSIHQNFEEKVLNAELNDGDEQDIKNDISSRELYELEKEILGDDFDEEAPVYNERKEDIKMEQKVTTPDIHENFSEQFAKSVHTDLEGDTLDLKAKETISSKKIQNAMKREDNEDTDYEKELLKLESEVVDEETDENIEILKKLLIEKTDSVKKKLDISGFTVVNRPISLNSSLSNIKELGTKRWVLMNTGIPFIVTEFKGDELEELSRISRSRSDNAALDVFTMIYNHIASRKPANAEDWMKVISYYDVDHLYMGIYNVCFSDVNYLPYNCIDTTKCKNVWLSDFQSIQEMCVFENDEAKDRFHKILEGDTNSDASVLYVSEIIPISEKYAFALKEPSIYSMTVGNVVQDQEFYKKYKQVIDILPWIDNVYDIDREAGQLRPVGYKEYLNNEQKTLKAKIITYANIIRRALSSDEYTDLITLIAAIDKRGKSLSYCIPETTCPKCKKVYPKEETSAYSLVFTRHRLGAIKNI